MIKVGDVLPDGIFKTLGADGPADVSTKDVFSGRKVAVFGVPGAFTGTCSKEHLPSFVKHYDELKAKGADDVVCLAVNDPFVLAAWAKAGGAEKIRMLSDWSGTYVDALGLSFDGSGFGLGKRSKRFSMVVEDGVVKSLNIEESPGKVTTTGGNELLAQL
jgi:glutaredoxin/glutathione-dependent peroxiredoxin